MSTASIVKELKETGNDYEWYPTSYEMLEVIAPFIKDVKVLDIGCGDCRFKTYMDSLAREKADILTEQSKQHALKEGKDWWKTYGIYDREVCKIDSYYVIEKAKPLLERLIEDAVVLETDFEACTLYDKKADVYFCNPPYSKYEDWTYKIITEGNFKEAFLIIPDRWESVHKIQAALKLHDTTYEILGNFDFSNAERQARAKVHVVRFIREKYCGTYRSLPDFNEDAFDKFFNEVFDKESDKRDEYEVARDKKEDSKQRIHDAIVSVEKGKAEVLVELYNADRMKLNNNLNAIMQLDEDVLAVCNISVNNVRKAIREKIDGLKSLYWSMVWEEFSEITERLTTDTREKLKRQYDYLNSYEFTPLNIWTVILYVVKHAGKYSDNQLVSFYKNLSDEENVRPYKSNTKLFEKSGWRWNSDEHRDYLLDYRIIMSSPFREGWHGEFEVDYRSKHTLSDIMVIARNLGFRVLDDIEYPDSFGGKGYLYFMNGAKKEQFMEFKAYKNGNMHVKFNIEFTKALNIECARLLGWIKTKADVAREMPVEYLDAFDKYFKCNYTPIGTNLKLLKG